MESSLNSRLLLLSLLLQILSSSSSSPGISFAVSSAGRDGWGFFSNKYSNRSNTMVMGSLKIIDSDESTILDFGSAADDEDSSSSSFAACSGVEGSGAAADEVFVVAEKAGHEEKIFEADVEAD